ncbi:glycosyltransferase, partial [Mycobacterium kiyosense]
MATDRGALSPAARRLKVAVVAYGSRGDVEPCVAVARELQRRGHEVRIALPPNMIELATATDLTAVDYGPDSRAHLDSAAELVRDCGLSNPVAALPRIIERINAVTAAKTATLKSVAQGADLIVAGFNEQGLAGIVAEYYGVPLAAVHYFPTKVFSSWGLVATMSKQAEATQRQALGLSADSGAAREILEIQAYDELCLPGPAAEWVAPGRRPFVGALTLALPTDTDDEV